MLPAFSRAQIFEGVGFRAKLPRERETGELEKHQKDFRGMDPDGSGEGVEPKRTSSSEQGNSVCLLQVFKQGEGSR